MNQVILIGRLTKDPETRYTSGSQMAVCTFTLAVDRTTKQGEEKKADFPRITVFGRQTENCKEIRKEQEKEWDSMKRDCQKWLMNLGLNDSFTVSVKIAEKRSGALESKSM